ncbi:hypothetical protein [Bradyrhizobium sp. CSA207]|uniref:ATP-dependent DNA ligase n=1 Tax=Bradyrhizobium sp. CSA207 TaxID=2698826 RepID=UPI0023B0CCDC|nr:hypothetical protein [Bradyrhizobium sp. CSA207]
MKHDGYRMLVIRENDRVRLLSRNGTDWTNRYPWIAEAALKNRQKHFVIDGEAVLLGVDGRSDFNALHSRKHDEEVQLYVFDIRWAAMTYGPCPCICARTTWPDFCAASRMASPLRLLSAARSGRTCSAPPAIWALRAWSPNTRIDLIAPAAPGIG